MQVTEAAMRSERLALYGDLLDVPVDPGFGLPARAEWGASARCEPGLAGVRFRPDHWLLVEDGRIVAAQPGPPGPDWRRVEHAGRLITPGFVDTHVHAPQLDV